MNLDTQFKIFNNVLLHQYLRKNSYWYKTLNRYPESFDNLLKEMKKVYRMNIEDKIVDVSERLKMMQMFMGVFK